MDIGPCLRMICQFGRNEKFIRTKRPPVFLENTFPGIHKESAGLLGQANPLIGLTEVQMPIMPDTQPLLQPKRGPPKRTANIAPQAIRAIEIPDRIVKAAHLEIHFDRDALPKPENGLVGKAVIKANQFIRRPQGQMDAGKNVIVRVRSVFQSGFHKKQLNPDQGDISPSAVYPLSQNKQAAVLKRLDGRQGLDLSIKMDVEVAVRAVHFPKQQLQDLEFVMR